MSSEKQKPKRDEERLYEPLRECLQNRFLHFYIDEKRPRFQRAPNEHEENVYLEIVGAKKTFTETLKKAFHDETFRTLSYERKYPDIMGFVKRKQSNQKELITVEVKRTTISLLDILQAKLYQDVFRSKFGLLVSYKEIPEEIKRFVLHTSLGRNIRGEVIIAQAAEKRWGAQYADRRLMILEIDSRFKDSIPKPFKELCKA
ncbi:MAG TPA: hypothetical protein VJ249_07090 [Candidatus Bathyarchaeia archaeon]|nr:hypothetical protein [Candidatus Bathyarchaeia archaeon]